jgi:acetolactate synthase-1/2/3 large subunit
MVAAGTSNDEVKTARGIRPLFDDDDAETGVVIENLDALGGPSVTSEPAGSHVEEER